MLTLDTASHDFLGQGAAAMIVSIDIGQLLTITANLIVVVGGMYGLWCFLKRRWQERSTDDSEKTT